MIRSLLGALSLVGFCALGQAPSPVRAQEATAQFGGGFGVTEIRLRSTTDIAILAPVMDRFVEQNPDLSVIYEQWGSNALYQNSRAACAGDIASADAVFSSAVHQMLALVNTACASAYRSFQTAALPASRRWRDQIWGLTEEPAVMVYNTDLVPDDDVPRSRFDLLDLMRRDPDGYRARIATYDIEESGLGYLFAFSDSLEATTFGALLEGFARTEAVATCCSAEIIEGVARGQFLIAYNVLGSYVNIASPTNVGVILPEDYTLFLTRAFMIPKGAAQKTGAARLLDFMLSSEGQRIMAGAGLIYTQDRSDTGLLPSARRYIALNLPLLVALDQDTSRRFTALWGNAFSPVLAP